MSATGIESLSSLRGTAPRVLDAGRGHGGGVGVRYRTGPES